MARTLSLYVRNVEQVPWNPGIFESKSPDLYVMVAQDGVNVLKTRVVKASLAPKWDEVANLTSTSTSSVINILLYHAPSFRMMPHICLGRCTLTIRELLQFGSQNGIDLDLKAKNKSKGRITVQLSSGESTPPNVRERMPGEPSATPGPSTRGQSGQLTTAELHASDNLTHTDAVRPRPAETEQRMEEILQRCTRSRIVLVGGSGVGKSKLINYVFKINDAKVSEWQVGGADIYSEFTSKINPRFVLHDSKGFEPANTDTFDLVRKFITEKSDARLELKDRLHAVWLLCIQTPTDGGRVIETGTEQLLKLAHELKMPVMVVFTQYDLLVRKYLYEGESLENSQSFARRDFDVCVQSLERAVRRLGISMPKYINVSVIAGYDDSIVPLVEMTRQTVEQYLGDAWIVWVAAQRASFKLKIDTCVEKGMSYYWRALSGSIPGAGKMLLQQCLLQVHRDIIACCNLPDEQNVLNGEEFKQLMLYDIQYGNRN
ncbi:hypothetical protein FB451DRAFT_1407795 [Mycena latifolia]|nr:hypothetical protein FB451DRAFT_1407795 [Mycena latifolia]